MLHVPRELLESMRFYMETCACARTRMNYIHMFTRVVHACS